jgi:hypothetical protein
VAATEADLGIKDRLLPLLERLKAAVHHEICDPEAKALKKTYADHIDKALAPEGVAAVAAVVAKVIQAVNPAFAVPSVSIYLALWLMKMGLNYWCSLPAPART